MAAEPFDTLADAYEAMIDWPKRLAAEEPFHRWLFGRVGARSVLDAACGTGHHAAMFHNWGLSVEGADISPPMIERCRAKYGESGTLRWAVRAYDQPTSQPGAFDVAICTGNSLALAPDPDTIARAIRQMLLAVRSGGALLVHVLNLWHLPDGPCRWQKCIRAALPAGDSLIVKGVHRASSRGYVDMVVTLLAGETPAMQTESVPFLGLAAAQLERMAHDAGAASVEIFGSYQRDPYDPQRSAGLILVALKT